MLIANPIYDVVFKYLMEDDEIAKLLIGAVIEADITELTSFPQEHTAHLEKQSLTVYRLDFAATIKTPEGTKRVLIEIQKAKFSTDIMRFRRYLGSQYTKATHTVIKKQKKKRKKIKKPLPIISIYFLGYSLEETCAPLIKVKRHYYDVVNHNREIKKKIEFIESLTHDSFVIQIPHLKKKHRTDIEDLLDIFDQNHQTEDENGQILNINAADYPEKYHFIIRRLQAAAAEPKVREVMDIEDDILEELENKEREIADKDKALADKDKALAEKDRALADKDKVLANNEMALADKDSLIKTLKKQIESSNKT